MLIHQSRRPVYRGPLEGFDNAGLVAAIRVENARLGEARLQQERLERELQLAMEIQQRFQPTAPPILLAMSFRESVFPAMRLAATTTTSLSVKTGDW